MAIVIAKNNTGSSINLNDLGIILLASEIRNLTDYFEYIELVDSEDLHNNVSSGNITINDGNIDLNITDALLHLSFESEYQDLQQDASITGVVTTDLPCVDISNSSQFSVPSSWTNTNFSNTDFENNIQVIQHNTSDDTQILIKEDGVYNIIVIYQTRVSYPSFAECHYRIVKNNNTVISYEKYQNLYKTEVHCYTENITRSLINGDVITSQIYSDDDVDIISCSMKITKQEGIRGEQGLSGGTTIDIQKDDTTITTNTDELNFEGSVNVIDEGNNKATVQILSTGFNNKFINVYDNTGHININTSTATAYVWDSQTIRDTDTFDHSTSTNKSRIYVLKDGWYKLSYCVSYDGTNSSRKNIKTYIRKNGNDIVKLTSVGSYVRNNYDDYGSNTLPAVIINLSNGNYIELMYHREGSSGSAYSYVDQCWLQLEYIRGI